MDQLELHKKIDEALMKSPAEVGPEGVSTLISANEDARRYFYAQADERWLGWLWDNGFLNVIKQKAKDPTKYGYQTPEVNYLVRMAGKNPAEVVDIILVTPVTTDTFNPEVVDRFLWICSTLPSEQLARLVQKIRDERWIPLMGVFNRWGFEYEKMLKTLADAKDDKSILTLAEAILAVQAGEDAKKTANSFGRDKPFYIDDLSHTKVFEYLANVSEEYGEQALSLTTKVMTEIILSGGKAESDAPFSTGDMFYLLDVDFFDLKPGAGRHLSDRDDVRELAAAITVLLRRLISDKCDRSEEVHAIYEKYIGDFDNPIPDSRTLWRLRLFVLSLCPEVFKDELKKAFFRLFEAKERYHEIISGAEYGTALRKGFSALSEADKRQYVEQVITFFSDQARGARDEEEQEWHKRYGSRILSVITGNLTTEEKQKVEKVGFVLDSTYEPEPSIGPVHAGTVVPQAPGAEDEWRKPVPDIVNLLKTDWTPAALKEKYKNADYLRPIDAEGVAERLKTEMASRPAEFIERASLFFDREKIDPHYTYAFLQNLYNLIREKKIAKDIDIFPIFKIMNAIAESAAVRPFEKDGLGDQEGWGWLADWDAVHNAMADLLKEMLGSGTEQPVDFKTNRTAFFTLIKYLLSHRDPAPKDEDLATAKLKTKSGGDADYAVGDPFTIAINSVRGRAFQALVNFTYRDSQLMPKDQPIKLASEVKEVYEDMLSKEATRAIIFMFGHYLPSFYFRDKEWVRSLLPQIFPMETEKKYLYLAAWEGYLANNLYQEMFFDPDIQKLYERGVALKEPGDPSRKHFKDPDEGLAVHLALAFMYYKDFGFKHPLFKAFWDDDSQRHGQFVSFLGRMFVSGDNANANKLLKENPLAAERLKGFWDWMLANYQDPKLFTEFGFWISLEKGLFEVAWLADHVKNTLEKTKGALDWDYGLMRSVVQLAKEAPEDTLAIARYYLLEGGVRGSNLRIPIHIDDEWLEALSTLYSNPTTKPGTYALVDDLVREGGSAFWVLKKVLDE